MTEPVRTTISAAAIVNHVLPELALVIDEAVNAAVGDELDHLNIQAERIADALESIAQSLSTFRQ